MIRLAALIAFLAAPFFGHAQALDGALKKITDTRTLTLAYRTDARPFSFNDDKGQPAGYTVDLCKAIAASLEQQLKVQGIKVNWVAATAQNRFDLVSKKQADMECGASTATLSRMENVDFSSLIFVDGTSMLIRLESGVKTANDLAGKSVGVITGTTNEGAVRDYLKSRLISATVVPFKNRDEAIAALEANKIDVFASDKVLILGMQQGFKDPSRYGVVPDYLSIEPLAIVLPRGDAPLRLAVNRALSQIYRSPTLVEIYQKWFGAFGKPSGLLEAMYLFGAVPE
jgi:ABC-type amino acid transport substrate-binding protein